MSPYEYRKEQRNKDSEKKSLAGDYPIKIKDGFIGYKHWSSIVLGSGNGKARDAVGCTKPAKVIYNRYLTSFYNSNNQLSIWAFGYDNAKQNAKFSGFYESFLPFYELNENLLENFTLEINDFIEMSNKVVEKIILSIEVAWGFKKSFSKIKFQKEKKAHKTSNKKTIKSAVLLSDLNKKFWGDTENDFYELLKKLKTLLSTNKNGETNKQFYSTAFFNFLSTGKFKSR